MMASGTLGRVDFLYDGHLNNMISAQNGAPTEILKQKQVVVGLSTPADAIPAILNSVHKAWQDFLVQRNQVRHVGQGELKENEQFVFTDANFYRSGKEREQSLDKVIEEFENERGRGTERPEARVTTTIVRQGEPPERFEADGTRKILNPPGLKDKGNYDGTTPADETADAEKAKDATGGGGQDGHGTSTTGRGTAETATASASAQPQGEEVVEDPPKKLFDGRVMEKARELSSKALFVLEGEVRSAQKLLRRILDSEESKNNTAATGSTRPAQELHSHLPPNNVVEEVDWVEV
ncbi:unnamed protein product [Amoebophrya sp. A25]|nr:unnamed protein product [Amoebophrya sp. A25]|eukprot:GSA25T00001621001.1